MEGDTLNVAELYMINNKAFINQPAHNCLLQGMKRQQLLRDGIIVHRDLSRRQDNIIDE